MSRLIFDDDGLIIAFLNNDGEEVMVVDQYWNDIDRSHLIVGIEIVEFEEDSKEKKCQTRADITKMEIATNEKVDIVSHPAHYTMGTIEPKDFIRDQGLNFNRGNVIKYTVRAGRKDKSKEIEDIRKAKQYLEFEIEYLEGQLNGDIKSK